MMLAEKLPKLGKVLWMDAWREKWLDEEGMREGKILRKEAGAVEVEIGGVVVPPGAQINLA